MNITKEQYAKIEKYFPIQRGNVKIDNYTFINAILYIAENGCKWNSVYQRFKKWCDTACFSCSATGKNHRNQSGGAGFGQHFLQTAPRCTREKSKGGWNTKLHVVSANDKVIVEMHLSGGNCHDAPQGRISIEHIGERYPGVPILMDKAYEGDKTRELCRLFGHDSVVPPKKN